MSTQEQKTQAAPKKGGNVIKLVAVVAVIAAAIFAMRHYGLTDYFTSPQKFDELTQWVQSFGILGPLILVAIWVVACVFFLPGLPVTLVGAGIFGPWFGSLYNLLGATIGATAAFIVGRYAARGMVEGLIQKNQILRKIDEGVDRQGWRMLMITRLVPAFPFNAQNYVYGLTKIKLPTYFFVTLIFMLPGTVMFSVLAGGMLEKWRKGLPLLDGQTVLYIVIAAGIFVVLSFIPTLIKKKMGGDIVENPTES